MKPSLLRLSFALALAAGVAAPVSADRDHDHDRAREALARGEILPLHAILPDLERQFRARPIEIELEREDGRLVYEIEFITPDGRIVEVLVDAASGTVLEQKTGDDD